MKLTELVANLTDLECQQDLGDSNSRIVDGCDDIALVCVELG